MPHKIRPIRIEGNIAYVPLTKGYEAIIDAADSPLVARWNWHASTSAWNVYAHRTSYDTATRQRVCMHRVIMGEPIGLEIDHIDGDGLNNRRSNLRAATHSENMRNRTQQKNNTSGFKRVCWHKQARKWTAAIKVNGRQKHLGMFDKAEDAHAAYCAAAANLHGEFARTE